MKQERQTARLFEAGLLIAVLTGFGLLAYSVL